MFDNENLEAYQIVNQSLKARFIYDKDKDYIVRENKIEIIQDSFFSLNDPRKKRRNPEFLKNLF